MGGGGGGSTNVEEFTWPGVQGEWLGPGYNFQEREFRQYARHHPLLRGGEDFILSYLPGVSRYLSDIISGGGQLTPQGERDVSQASRVYEEQLGTSHTEGAIGRSLLNREQAQQNRLGWATGQATNILNQLAGFTGAEVGAAAQTFNPILAAITQILGYNMSGRIAEANIAQQQNAAKGSTIGGGIGAAGSVIGAALPLLFSDERLKRKIKDTGLKTEEGIPLKTFEYNTKPGILMLGVLAQDVEKKVPSAVRTDSNSGIKLIDADRFPIIKLGT